MHRTTITWPAAPINVQLRAAAPAAPVRPHAGFPGGLPDLTGAVSRPAPPSPPPVDLRPLLEQVLATCEQIAERRTQSLEELQQVAVELAVAAASQLVFQALDADQFGVGQLVNEAVARLGLESPVRILLHPRDVELLRQHPEGKELLSGKQGVSIAASPSVSRGGCHAESESGCVVSEISSRLSDMRRHWMEELDDSQVERRRTATESNPLRRFPDRRETA